MTVELGQGITIERVDDHLVRVCSKGICREAKNEEEAYRFAIHFGWKPSSS